MSSLPPSIPYKGEFLQAWLRATPERVILVNPQMHFLACSSQVSDSDLPETLSCGEELPPTVIAGSQRIEVKSEETIIGYLVFLPRLDPLTNIPHRDTLENEFHRWCESIALPDSVEDSISTGFFWFIFLDLDRFKTVNDRWGHLAGDDILRQFATQLAEFSQARGGSVIRYGGDEFILFLRAQTDPIAELSFFQEELQKLPSHSYGYTPTFSYGLTNVVPGDDLEGAIRRADRKLYEEKFRVKEMEIS